MDCSRGQQSMQAFLSRRVPFPPRSDRLSACSLKDSVTFCLSACPSKMGGNKGDFEKVPDVSACLLHVSDTAVLEVSSPACLEMRPFL